jgi:ATP-dependent Clp protease ATP-binding subunit ClpA
VSFLTDLFSSKNPLNAIRLISQVGSSLPLSVQQELSSGQGKEIIQTVTSVASTLMSSDPDKPTSSKEPRINRELEKKQQSEEALKWLSTETAMIGFAEILKEVIDMRKELGGKNNPSSARKSCFGRDKEIREIFKTLMHTENGHVYIQGQPGSEKATLLYEIAQRIIDEDPAVPQSLLNKTIYLLKAPEAWIIRQIAGMPGKPIILCDEGELLFEDKKTRAAVVDLLTANKISLIVTSDLTFQLGTYLDVSLQERFTHIKLPYMSREFIKQNFMQTYKKMQATLRSLWFPWLEHDQRPQIEITEQAIDEVILLADILAPERSFPRKGFDLLEETCAEVLMTYMQKEGFGARRSQDISTESEEKIKKDYSCETIEITPDHVRSCASLLYGISEADIAEKIRNDAYNAHAVYGEALRPYVSKNYTIDSEKGEISPAYGRDKEIEDLLDTLCSGHSILLTAPSGFGKSYLIRALADVIRKGGRGIPPAIQKKHLVQLNVQKIMRAGDESVIVQAMIKYGKECIYIMDESCALFLNRAFDAFKDSMALREIQIIAIMTSLESHLINDPAIRRRFDKQSLPALLVTGLIEIFQKKSKSLSEKFHKEHQISLAFDLKFFAALVFLALKYLPDENPPGSIEKLFDLFIGSLVRKATTRTLRLTPQLLCKFVHQKYERPGSLVKIVEDDLNDSIAYYEDPRNQIIPSSEPLMQLTTNWTHRAKRGDFPNLQGREEELREMLRVLTDIEKNNIILLGSPGVGKTTLVAMLACALARNEVRGCELLKDTLLLTLKTSEITPLNISSFLESARRYKGFFILFVDEVTPFLEEFFDKYLKPDLACGLRLIGATTEGELKESLSRMAPKKSEKNPSSEDSTSEDSINAFERRFQRISVQEMSEEDTVTILRAQKTSWEEDYSKAFKLKVTIDEENVFPFIAQQRKGKQPPLPDGACTVVRKILSKYGQAAAEAEEKALHITQEMAKDYLKKHPSLQKPAPRENTLGVIPGERSDGRLMAPSASPQDLRNVIGNFTNVASQVAQDLGVPRMLVRTVATQVQRETDTLLERVALNQSPHIDNSTSSGNDNLTTTTPTSSLSGRVSQPVPAPSPKFSTRVGGWLKSVADAIWSIFAFIFCCSDRRNKERGTNEVNSDMEAENKSNVCSALIGNEI